MRKSEKVLELWAFLHTKIRDETEAVFFPCSGCVHPRSSSEIELDRSKTRKKKQVHNYKFKL